MAKKKKKKAAGVSMPSEAGMPSGGRGFPGGGPAGLRESPAGLRERPAWLRVGSIVAGILLAILGFLMILEFFAARSSDVDYTALANFYAVVVLIALPLAVGAFLITSGTRQTVSKARPLEAVFTAAAAVVLVLAAILSLYISIRNISQGQRVAIDVILVVLSLAALVWAAFMTRGLFRKG